MSRLQWLQTLQPKMLLRICYQILGRCSLSPIYPCTVEKKTEPSNLLANTGVKVQVVLPGATATDFWSKSGIPVEYQPQQIVMSAEDMVDAALAGFDQEEFVTIPALPDAGQWETYEAARQALMPNLSRAEPAPRYGIVRAAA